jgi:hypothetical protein
MWALLSTRLRTWLLFAVAVPLGGAGARALARRLERRGGPTRLTRGLHTVGDLASRRGRRGGRGAGTPEVTRARSRG